MKESRLHKRDLVRLGVSLVLTLLVAALFLSLYGYDPVLVGRSLYEGTWAQSKQRAEILVTTIPLALIALGYTLSFRVSWNIGGEGQYIVGAAAATFVALKLTPSLPQPIPILAVVVTGLLAGIGWMLAPAILKVKANLNEAFTSLMMNLIAIKLAEFVYSSWLMSAKGGFPRTDRIPDNVQLGTLAAGTRLHYGLVIAIGLSLVIYLMVSRTTLGYRLAAVGKGPMASRYAGIPIRRVILGAMLAAAAFAGMAGAIQTTVVSRRLDSGVAAGYGNLAIMIVMMAGLNPLLVLPMSIGVATILTGSKYLQITMGVPDAMAKVIVYGALLTFIIVRNELELEALRGVWHGLVKSVASCLAFGHRADARLRRRSDYRASRSVELGD